MWQKLKETLRKASEETLGRTKSERKKRRGPWWWNKDVRKVLKEKKLAFKRWQKSILEIDRVEYRLKRREAKRIIAIARRQGTQELYDELETKEGDKRLYRIARTRYRERDDAGNINIIKDNEGKILFKKGMIGTRWANYFEELNLEMRGKR